jgi:hypothetical protein
MKFHHIPTKPRVALLVISLALLAAISLSALSLSTSYGESRTEPDQPSGFAERPTSQTPGVTPRSGPPGSRISVSGFGFRGFAPVTSITLGGLDILGNLSFNTDQQGNFQADDLIVPGLDPGPATLVVKVGTEGLETSAIASFEVTAPTGPLGGVLPPAEALAPLGDALERVFHFDNSTKTWSFYDPRPEFADVNTLNEVVEGQVYWMKVTHSVSASLNGKQRELSCANEGTPQEDCWNLVVW